MRIYPKKIFLQNIGDETTWCETPVKGEMDVISECEYIHHDIVEQLRTRNARLEAAGDKLLVPYSFVDDNSMMSTYCNYCDAIGKFNHETLMWELPHADNCAITAWQQAKLEGK